MPTLLLYLYLPVSPSFIPPNLGILNYARFCSKSVSTYFEYF